ncbi:hypothetical protein RFI_23752 [Reticulomyxa filosa]|uniref:Uncharacterized protein n=1 Tax=Reticulomyxa filosa TaxID=46433 RepID=X6MJJ0_RETFI|nr:hypothetical protein RFI_23752 [Reticulomyxa filosa]|eukprot:ETO13612.1 hypothetical protein RFI_23752 [Reticulomyxa filosa]
MHCIFIHYCSKKTEIIRFGFTMTSKRFARVFSVERFPPKKTYFRCRIENQILTISSLSEMATKTENDEGGIKGLQELTAMLSSHLQLMQDQDSYVESAISMCEKATQTLLRKAKERSLTDEKKLLQSLGVLQLGTFCVTLYFSFFHGYFLYLHLFRFASKVLVERMYDEMYEPLREEQKMARSLYAPKLEEYEKKPKPVTQVLKTQKS